MRLSQAGGPRLAASQSIHHPPTAQCCAVHKIIRAQSPRERQGKEKVAGNDALPADVKPCPKISLGADNSYKGAPRMPRSPLIEHSLRPQILDENGPLRTEKKADWLDGEDHA